MATRTKTENAAALAAAGIGRGGYSRDEFSARWNLSPGLYKNLRRRGLIKETPIFDTDRVIITAAQDAEFGEALEAYRQKQRAASDHSNADSAIPARTETERA